MTHPTYIHADAILDAARARGRQESAKTKREQRDPDTGKQFWLYCSVADFMIRLQQVEREKGIIHERQTQGLPHGSRAG